MVMVAVMHGEFTKGLAGEFAAATSAHMGEQGERPVAVTLLTQRLVTLHIGQELRLFSGVKPLLNRGHKRILKG